MNIDELGAGRELDALVAEKVMGWKRVQTSIKTPPDPMLEYWADGVGDNNLLKIMAHYLAWSPSTSISAAWEVVEKFRRGIEGHAAAVIEMVVSDDVTADDCSCKIYGPSLAEVEGIGNEMPLAICRAALKATAQKEGGSSKLSHIDSLTL